MEYKNLIKKENYFISFKNFAETKEAEIALRVILYGSDNETDLLLEVQNNIELWQIDFSSFATYAVTFEDFTTTKEDEIYQGDSFRIYEKSDLIDYLRKRTNIEVQELLIDKKYYHFSMACMEHQIDIVSNDQPIVKVKRLNESF